MNPTKGLHNCYELVEFLCEIDNKESKAVKLDQAAKKEK
jgi:hypothetical protein